jgi:hypothetical protein
MGDAVGGGSGRLRVRTCQRSGNRAIRGDNRNPLRLRKVLRLPSVCARRFCTAPSMHRSIGAVCQVADISGGRVPIEDSDDYRARLRIAAKEAVIAKSAPSRPIAHCDRVGMEVPAPANGAQVGTLIVFASVVTVPPNARALPVKFAKCPIVIPAASRIFPTKAGVSDSAALAPSVVAPTGAQNTSEAKAPPAKITLELAPVLSAPPGLKM